MNTITPSLFLILGLILVLIICVKFNSYIKNKKLLKSKKTKAFEQGLKEKLPKLFNKDNWRVISEERVCYKPTGEDFSWGITYLDDLVLMFPRDIERQMTYDEQMILFNFLNELTTNAFKNGSWDDRKDLIRKYG